MNDILYGLPFAEYLKAPRISQSALKHFEKSPAHYKASLTIEDKDTKDKRIGRAVHCAVLEPNEFNNRYAVYPEKLDKRTKEGKALFAEFEESAIGKEILSLEEYETAINCAKSVTDHETVKSLMSKGHPEVSIFTELEGVPVKCRLDWYRENIILDLKTTDDASPQGFLRSIFKYGYHIQAAWYMDCCSQAGLPVTNFILVAVEKTAPYAVGIYELDDLSIERGIELYRCYLSQYKECTESNDWTSYSREIVTLKLPSYAFFDN